METLKALEQKLTSLRSEVELLQEKRREHMQQVRIIDRKLTRLTGESVSDGSETSTLPGLAGKSGSAIRNPNTMPTKGSIADRAYKILLKHPIGLNRRDLYQAMKSSGYKSQAKDPMGTVCIVVKSYKHLFKLNDGLFTAIKPESGERT